MSAAYLDSSAFVKIIVKEPETDALRRFLKRWPSRVSSALLRAEALRAIRPHGPEALTKAVTRLSQVNLVGMDDELLEAAGKLDPPALRTLDAIHVASALTLGTDLGVLVTYDRRLAEACKAMAIKVESPS